jgi:hypothetical protein
MGPECKAAVTRRSDADPCKKADPSSFINPAASRFAVSIAEVNAGRGRGETESEENAAGRG